jgi:hypothetical protein
MAKATRHILFSSIILAAAIIVMYTLNMLDHIIRDQLYKNYLQYSLDWAGPYWNLLRVLQICSGIIAGITLIDLALTIRLSINSKKTGQENTFLQKPSQITRAPLRTSSVSSTSSIQTQTPVNESRLTMPSPPTQVSSKASELEEPTKLSASTSTIARSGTSARPTPSKPSNLDIPGMIRCSNCGKAFTQPLQMLDFQGERPRIVNICPFCNETIKTTSHQKN